MDKLWWAFWVLALFGQRIAAQTASDFTVTDIDGGTHNLYTKLDQGKIVILAFFSTDSRYSFAYHNSEDLLNLYDAHGPDGDNQLEIYYIEGDPNTNDNCITGQSNCLSPNNTFQDWTYGIDFPIVSSPALAQQFGVTEYPSIFVICPGKRLRSLPTLRANALWEAASECPVPYGSNNVGVYYFDAGLKYDEICINSTLQPQFQIVNLGANPISNLNLVVKFNDLYEKSYPVSGTLMKLEERTIPVDDIIISDTGTLSVSIQSNFTDANPTDNIRSQQFTKSAKFIGNELKLRFRTDAYGAETYWEIREISTGQVMRYGGNSCVGADGGGELVDPDCPSSTNVFPNHSIATANIVLPAAGCYELRVIDAGGDGFDENCINCGYFLYELPNSYLNAPVQGRLFRSADYCQFEVLNIVPTNDNSIDNDPILRVQPNPVGEKATFQYQAHADQSVQFTVLNASGHIVYQSSVLTAQTGPNTWHVDTASLPSGIYVAVFSTNEGVLHQKIVKN